MKYIIKMTPEGDYEKLQVEEDTLNVLQIARFMGIDTVPVAHALCDDFEEYYTVFVDADQLQQSGLNVEASAFCDHYIYGPAIIAKVFGDEITPLSDELENDEDLFNTPSLAKEAMAAAAEVIETLFNSKRP